MLVLFLTEFLIHIILMDTSEVKLFKLVNTLIFKN
jgi:hypothetical protein